MYSDMSIVHFYVPKTPPYRGFYSVGFKVNVRMKVNIVLHGELSKNYLIQYRRIYKIMVKDERRHDLQIPDTGYGLNRTLILK